MPQTPTPLPLINDYDLTAAEITFYNDQGFLPLPNLVRKEKIEALRDEVKQVLAANGIDEQRLRKASGSADKLRQNHQYLAGSLLDELINGERTRAVAGRLIGGEAIRYLPFTAVKAGGGGGTFDYHQDNNYTPHDPATGSLNIWVALVDMSPANGCLQVVPNSHKHGQLDSVDVGDGHRGIKVDPDKLLPVRMRAGDAVAFTRWTVHGSGPNTTDEPRWAYALQYHRPDVRWRARDAADDEPWKLLVEEKRFDIEPIERLGPARTPSQNASNV